MIPILGWASVSLPRPYLGNMPDPAPAQLDAAAASRLRRLNVIVGSVHALQAVVLLAIATAASLPITASFLIGPPGAGDYGSASLGSVRIDWLVAAFLFSPRSTTSR